MVNTKRNSIPMEYSTSWFGKIISKSKGEQETHRAIYRLSINWECRWLHCDNAKETINCHQS
jgi:hypothetical protein